MVAQGHECVSKHGPGCSHSPLPLASTGQERVRQVSQASDKERAALLSVAVTTPGPKVT